MSVAYQRDPLLPPSSSAALFLLLLLRRRPPSFVYTFLDKTSNNIE
jgi:hypothetical protein